MITIGSTVILPYASFAQISVLYAPASSYTTVSLKALSASAFVISSAKPIATEELSDTDFTISVTFKVCPGAADISSE